MYFIIDQINIHDKLLNMIRSGGMGDRIILIATGFATDPCRGSSASFVKN